jgi:hypothetical protein
MRVQTRALIFGVLTFFITITVTQTVTPQSPTSEERKKKLGNFDPADVFGERDRKKEPSAAISPLESRKVAPFSNRGAVSLRTRSKKRTSPSQSAASAPASSVASLVETSPTLPSKTESIASSQVPIQSTTTGPQSNVESVAQSSSSATIAANSKSSNQPIDNLPFPITEGGSRQNDRIFTLSIISSLFVIVLFAMIVMIIKFKRIKTRIS